MIKSLHFRKIAVVITSCFAVFSIHTAKAQDIPNPGFEDWSGGNPVGWNTVNQNILGIDIITVTKDVTNPHGGTASAKLESILKSIPFVGQITAPGMLSLGEIIIDINNMTGNVEGGIPVSGSPVALKGWYRYAPAAGDSCIIGIGLSRWNGTGRDTLALSYKLIGDQVANWTQFELPVDYLQAEQPDTMNIMFFSSNLLAGNLVAGSKLWVDDLWLDYSSVAVNDVGLDKGFRVLGTLGNDCLEVHRTGDEAGMLQIIGMNGALLSQQETSSGEILSIVDISQLKPAMYLLSFVNKAGERRTVKFVKN